MKDTKCYLCHAEGNRMFVADQREIFICPNCELAWTKDFKQPVYSKYHNDSTYLECRTLFDNIFARIQKIAESYIAKKGRVFEVGASVGGLLSTFQKNGWDVSGVEPSHQAVAEANKNGIKVLEGSFEKVYLKDNYYDLVLINHTLEHLEDPKAVLQKIYNILKPDGVVMIGVPNIACLKVKILKGNWTHLLPDEHKWHFSPRSLSTLVEKSELKPVGVFTASGVFEHQKPFAEILTALKERRKRFFTNLVNLPLDFLETTFGYGEGLLLVAKK